MNRDDMKQLLDITGRIMKYTHNKEIFGNICRGEFFVMNLISSYCVKNKNEKGITVTKIANMLFYGKANMSKLLRNMESKGYITRIFDDDDRRVVYIRLTDEGDSIIKNARKKSAEKFYRIFEKMGEKDFNEYLSLSKKLYSIILEEASTPSTDQTDEEKTL